MRKPRLTVRLTDHEFRMLKSLAMDRKETPSEFTRWMLKKAYEERTGERWRER